MTTISSEGFWFWASCGLHGDHFHSRLLILGFMRALWRPFSLKAFGFELHASSMATISHPRLLILGFMRAPWRPFPLKAFGFGLHASSMATVFT
ncbi:hypothetical protein, partial [Cytobacillus pseudoceanisediminis]|uniref:hypothetical protein n=1 Tax=Cytobacillus pseudoceanisediminis TaxID=3051614 RepID=UPI003C30DECA